MRKNMKIHVKGYVLSSGNESVDEQVSKLVYNYCESKDPSSLLKYAESLNGFYSIVCVYGNHTIIFSDRIRSYNNCYSLIDKEWELNPISFPRIKNGEQLRYFETCGYTLGADTVYEGVYQCLAGTIVILENGTPDAISLEYTRFDVTDGDTSDEEILSKMKDEIIAMSKVFPDRKYLVPLSGGYDSRFILTLMIEVGISKSDILTYTYGNEKSKEVLISKQVASSLGVKWVFVKQDRKFWKQWLDSEYFKSYLSFSFNFSSCPVIQDWPVIGHLLEKDIINKDFVVVPGHAGDFVAGSHFIEALVKTTPNNICQAHNYIKSKHFALAKIDSEISKELKVYLNEYNNTQNINTEFETAASYFEWWDWRERQSKLIMNSVRAYEFWGLSWWCPFWGKSVFDAYKNIGFLGRINTKKYLSVVNATYSLSIGEKPQDIGSERSNISSNIKSLIKKNLPAIYESDIALNIIRRRKYESMLKYHPMGWNYIPQILDVDDKLALSFYNVFAKYTLSEIVDVD